MQCSFPIVAEIVDIDCTFLDEVAHNGDVAMCNCYLKGRPPILRKSKRFISNINSMMRGKCGSYVETVGKKMAYKSYSEHVGALI